MKFKDILEELNEDEKNYSGYSREVLRKKIESANKTRKAAMLTGNKESLAKVEKRINNLQKYLATAK